jgi:hypothetical protein
MDKGPLRMKQTPYFKQGEDGLLSVNTGPDLHTTFQKEVLARTLNLMHLASRDAFTIGLLQEELPIRITRCCVQKLVNNLVASKLVLQFVSVETATSYFYKINLD